MTNSSGPDSDFAELADLILNVARLVRALTPTDAGEIGLTDTERHVMRIVDLYPGCAPSEIAQRARLQRTNVSAALRSLEMKGMITRQAKGGRRVAVSPTELATTNLQSLRSAWSDQLQDVLGHDRDAVRRCNRLLGQLERSLTALDAG